MRFEKTSETSAVLVYRSRRRPEDRVGLEGELGELWEAFRPEVEAQGLRMAVLEAQCKVRGFLPGGTLSLDWVLRRQPDGAWARIPKG